MGSRGIRRRKPVHHLPKVSDRETPSPDDLVPPVMWPSKGSGFEADPFSPAGTAQRYWWGVRKATEDYQPISFRTYLVMMVLLVVIIGGIALGMALH